MKHALLFALVFALAGCLPDTNQAPEAATAESAAEEQPEFVTYGTMTESGEEPMMLTADAVVSNPAEYGDGAVRVEGTIAKVCQMKGCWITLQSESGDNGNLRIEVPRDEAGEYVYTFPKDLGTVRMVVEGTVEVREEDAEAVAHFEADGDEAATVDEDGARTQVVLVATGAMVEAAEPPDDFVVPEIEATDEA
ncbi:MAG: DUF4920 domain-containing protein [Bacteroidota bacterium]